MKLGRLEHVFITQPTWKNMGGLPGAALTIQDVGVPHITLHGPPGLVLPSYKFLYELLYVIPNYLRMNYLLPQNDLLL